jgi:multidrug efflux system membrane fusion protein
MGFFQNGLDSVKSLNAKANGFRRVISVLVLAGLAGGGWYYFSSKGEADNDKRAGSKNRPVSVVIGEVKRGDITVSLNALGTVIPRNIVTVYPQVSGVLKNVFFKEGEMVQAGQVLAQIDPRSYEATLKQAQGALERDKNLLRNAELDLKRYETLIAQESVSTQVYDTQRALVDQYRGNVLTDQGSVDAAKLQVEFASITSPITGRIGLRQVDPGNLIQANSIVRNHSDKPNNCDFHSASEPLEYLPPKIKSLWGFVWSCWLFYAGASKRGDQERRQRCN